MNEKRMEKEEKERKEKENKGQVRTIEEEEDGVDMEEARVEIRMRGTTIKEEAEEDIEEEEEVVIEVVIEVADEGDVGRNLLPLPRRCLPRLWQEVSK